MAGDFKKNGRRNEIKLQIKVKLSLQIDSFMKLCLQVGQSHYFHRKLEFEDLEQLHFWSSRSNKHRKCLGFLNEEEGVC